MWHKLIYRGTRSISIHIGFEVAHLAAVGRSEHEDYVQNMERFGYQLVCPD